jgi:NAD(P)H-dependent flavin oxidoreductase YrpB (nitropropane dioxygenase family)
MTRRCGAPRVFEDSRARSKFCRKPVVGGGFCYLHRDQERPMRIVRTPDEARAVMSMSATSVTNYPIHTPVVHVAVTLNDQQWAAVLFALQVAGAVDSIEGAHLVPEDVTEWIRTAYEDSRTQIMADLGARLAQAEKGGSHGL